jgi:uncharacterized protein Smg (DUF494 family)
MMSEDLEYVMSNVAGRICYLEKHLDSHEHEIELENLKWVMQIIFDSQCMECNNICFIDEKTFEVTEIIGD